MLNVEVKKITNVKYGLFFNHNLELINNLKKLECEYLTNSNCWVLNSLNLYFLISKYKGRNDIFFDFEPKEKENFRKKYKKAYDKYVEELNRKNKIFERNKYALEYKEKLENTKHDPLSYSNIFVNEIKPYNHQIISAEFINKIESGILALDMGLGKTLTIIFSFELNPSIKKALIIVPNSLKYSFGDDIEKIFSIPYYIINSKDNKYSIEESKYFIVNYEYFQRTPFDVKTKLKPYGLDKDLDAIALDESHKIANSKSNRTKCITKQFKNVPVKILSSGTPIKSEPDELFTQLKFIDPYTFSNKTKFLNEYCGKFYNPNTGVYFFNKSKQQLDILHKKLQSYMIRYKTEDVIDLPDMLFNNIKLEMNDKDYKEYCDIEKGVIFDIDTNQFKLTQKIVVLGRLKQFLSKLKIKYLKELIDDLIFDNQKIVFIDYYKESLKELHNLYPNKCVLHYGDQNLDERRESIKIWKSSKTVPIFAASSSTTQEGLTLTESNLMILNTLTPATCDQIFKRIHRISQDKTCHYYIPIFKDTIDVDIYNLVISKKEIFSKLIDNEELKDNATEYEIDEIIERIRKRKT